MYKSIYVPVDNSDHSNRAIACSLALGKAYSAKLVGCHGHSPVSSSRVTIRERIDSL